MSPLPFRRIFAQIGITVNYENEDAPRKEPVNDISFFAYIILGITILIRKTAQLIWSCATFVWVFLDRVVESCIKKILGLKIFANQLNLHIQRKISIDSSLSSLKSRDHMIMESPKKSNDDEETKSESDRDVEKIRSCCNDYCKNEFESKQTKQKDCCNNTPKSSDGFSALSVSQDETIGERLNDDSGLGNENFGLVSPVQAVEMEKPETVTPPYQKSEKKQSLEDFRSFLEDKIEILSVKKGDNISNEASFVPRNRPPQTTDDRLIYENSLYFGRSLSPNLYIAKKEKPFNKEHRSRTQKKHSVYQELKELTQAVKDNASYIMDSEIPSDATLEYFEREKINNKRNHVTERPSKTLAVPDFNGETFPFLLKNGLPTTNQNTHSNLWSDMNASRMKKILLENPANSLTREESVQFGTNLDIYLDQCVLKSYCEKTNCSLDKSLKSLNSLNLIGRKVGKHPNWEALKVIVGCKN